MNFALASMDALMYPFFWTWKVSRVLGHYPGGALEAIVSIIVPVGHRCLLARLQERQR